MGGEEYDLGFIGERTKGVSVFSFRNGIQTIADALEKNITPEPERPYQLWDWNHFTSTQRRVIQGEEYILELGRPEIIIQDMHNNKRNPHFNQFFPF